MKRLLFLAALLIAPIMQSHALIIGIARHFPPFSTSTGPNQFSGFEVELSKAICQRINETCSYMPVTAGSIPNALLTQTIDLGISMLIIPSKNVTGYIFSQPYFISSMQFIVKNDSKINALPDLINKTVGVRTIFGLNSLENFISTFIKGPINFQAYPTLDDMMDALQNDNLHAGMTNAYVAQYWVDNNSKVFRLVGDPIPYGNGYGIMANVGREALIAKINDALKAMMNDGTYATIYSHYFLN